MEANERLNGLRQKQIQDEMAQMRDKPTITEYDLKEGRTPIHLRDSQRKSYDQMIKDMRDSNPDRYINQLQECTFSPAINHGRGNQVGDRGVDDLLNWGQEKIFKQTTARMNAQTREQCSFSPNINERSKRLIGQRNGEVHDRLMQSGKSRDKKLAQTLKLEKNQMFSPSIGKKSRQLADKIGEQTLVKQDNGQTANLDFFYAIPKDASKDTLYKRGLSQDRLLGQNVDRHAERCDNFQPAQKTLPGSKKNPNPEYVSPYTKEIVQTDIPLKTILNKAEKLRNSPRKQLRKVRDRSQSRSKSPERNQSRSRSKSRSRDHSPEKDDFNSIKLLSLSKSKSRSKDKKKRSQSPGRGHKIQNFETNQLDSYLQARKQNLDSKFLAQEQERKNKSRQKKQAKKAIYSEKLSPSQNDKFKKHIGITTSKNIALDSQKKSKQSPETNVHYFTEAYFNGSQVITRDLRDWEVDV